MHFSQPDIGLSMTCRQGTSSGSDSNGFIQGRKCHYRLLSIICFVYRLQPVECCMLRPSPDPIESSTPGWPISSSPGSSAQRAGRHQHGPQVFPDLLGLETQIQKNQVQEPPSHPNLPPPFRRNHCRFSFLIPDCRFCRQCSPLAGPELRVV